MKTEERVAFLREIIDRISFLPLSPQARSFFVPPQRECLSAGNNIEIYYMQLIGIRKKFVLQFARINQSATLFEISSAMSSAIPVPACNNKAINMSRLALRSFLILHDVCIATSKVKREETENDHDSTGDLISFGHS